MFSLVDPDSKILTKDGNVLLSKNPKKILVYLIEGYLCFRDKKNYSKKYLTNVTGYKVTTEKEKKKDHYHIFCDRWVHMENTRS